MERFLSYVRNSEQIFKEDCFLKKAKSFIVNYNIEAFEIFNSFTITACGVWFVMHNKNISNAFFAHTVFSQLSLGLAAIFIGIFSAHAMLSSEKDSSILSRKHA